MVPSKRQRIRHAWATECQACSQYEHGKVLSGVDGTAAHDGPSIDAEELIRTKDVQVRAVFAASSAVFWGRFALGALKRPDDIQCCAGTAFVCFAAWPKGWLCEHMLHSKRHQMVH